MPTPSCLKDGINIPVDANAAVIQNDLFLGVLRVHTE